MRKALALVLSGMIIASLAIFISGCGLSGEDKALQYINRGDAYAYRMASEGEKMSAALQGFFDILQGPNPEAIINTGGPLEQYESAREEMSSFSFDAQAEFNNVLSLKGVEEEKEYATMMVEVAKKTGELADFVEEWFNRALDIIKTLDEKKIRSYLTGEEFEGGLAKIDELRAGIEATATAAKDYRLEGDF